MGVTGTDAHDEHVGFRALVEGLLEANLAARSRAGDADPPSGSRGARRDRRRHRGDDPDAAGRGTRPGTVLVHDGEDPWAEIVVRAESMALLELAGTPLRFGLPDALTPIGRDVLVQIGRRRIRVRGLIRNLGTVRRLIDAAVGEVARTVSEVPVRPDEAPAQRVRERRWAPALIVAALIVVVAQGARTVADATAGAIGPAVTVGSAVTLQPRPGWDLESTGMDPPAARFHRGPVLLDVVAYPPTNVGPAAVAAGYVEQTLRPGLAQVSVGSAAPIGARRRRACRALRLRRHHRGRGAGRGRRRSRPAVRRHRSCSTRTPRRASSRRWPTTWGP